MFGRPGIWELLHCTRHGRTTKEPIMITLGAVLLIIGFVAKIAILWTLGVVLLVVGAVLYLLGATGRAVGGRRHYW